jgi:diguanylate cyclase (GGDEF)-like protein/PAS domain S-box-containing protein
MGLLAMPPGSEARHRTSGAYRQPYVPVLGRPSERAVKFATGRVDHPVMWDEQWLETLVANIPGAIYRCALNSDWEMLFMSREIARITGYPASDFIGNEARSYASVIHPEDRDRVEVAVHECVSRGDPFVLEYRVVHADGDVRWVHEQGRAVVDDDGEVLFLDGAIFDVSDRKLLEAQLEHLAYHDPLTDLPNRLLFTEHVELALARARRTPTGVAVLFVDLDDFKLVNDSFGHAIGDQLLQEVARRMHDAVRETDTLARQGGDEFLVLMADVPADPGSLATDAVHAAVKLAERLRNVLADPVVLSGVEVYVSASVGISVYPQDGDTPEQLLKRADVAMYDAKAAGRGGHAVYAEDPDDSLTRLSLAGRLRRAVELDQFELHYQPLVELASGRMMGVEALIRWHDPERGLVAPNDFIPLAERTGAIHTISEWVIEEACRQSHQWQAQGLDLYVSVNLPARFWRLAAMRSVLETVTSFGLGPGRVMIEITESAAMEHPENNGAIIDALLRGGVGVAIDDFGTGHSSLARLSQLAVTTLKIDRSFIRDLPHDANAAVLVNGIIQLARSLGLTPLAEGIETEEQRAFLLEHDCHLGQGYHFSRPVPAAEIPLYVPPAGPRARAAV